ncbi:cyanophycin synthetase [Duganella sp. CF517]|uniref:cyanophycin synthetase family protein n=1 Tax=Duganella sp. CF517 TaxID=1881038 RepID=UPI0008D117A5|nr:cyanophycin synthetase [Duganella sp. CF517]SEO05092.1 cyanophycin synthetase [Duganella sp. CF517]
MNILEQRVLRGPNLYSTQPCILTVLDLQELRELRSSGIAGFNQRLLDILPSLQEDRGPAGQYGGFARALREGTNLAHVVEHVALALQCLAGTPVGAGRTREAGHDGGRYRVVCEYALEQLGVDAIELAIALVRALAGADREQPDGAAAALLAPGGALEDGLAALRETARRQAIGTSTGAILKAAARRGIPFTRLTPEANLFVLGWGARQKRLQASITGDTGHIAVGIAADKALTKALLREAGVPVPEGTTVRSLEQAQRAALALGGQVTVKPLDGNHGRGVTTRCGAPDEVALAFERAREHGRTIIVERYIRGDDYRVLVAGGRVVAAALRRPAGVAGDGVSTVRELIDRENANPARGAGHSNILTRIALDGHAETTLAEQGLTLDSVAAAGRRVLLRGNANLSSGGTAEDVTDRVPPSTLAMCVRAVRKIGLDVAGIDLVCEDIGVPLDGRNGAVIEINAAPGLRMHEYPSAGTPRDAGAAIVDAMFGAGDGRIPVIAVGGASGTTATTLMIGRALRQAGIGTGCATSEGVSINGEAIAPGDRGGYRAARSVLAAPEVEFAVLETARGDILRHGLAFDRCDVALLLNIGDHHPAEDGVGAGMLDELAPEEAAMGVMAVVAWTAARALVLDAGDQRCVAVGAGVDPAVELVYFSGEARHPVLAAHLARGGRAAWLEHGALMLADGKARHRLLEADAIPGAPDRRHIAHAPAAAAALMAAGLDPAMIAAGLRSFVPDARRDPPRAGVRQAGAAMPA